MSRLLLCLLPGNLGYKIKNNSDLFSAEVIFLLRFLGNDMCWLKKRQNIDILILKLAPKARARALDRAGARARV